MTIATSTFASQLAPEHRSEIIREVYRKHAAELLAIEEAQQKLVLLLLGVFGTGASFLASEKTRPLQAFWPRVGLTVLVLALLAIAGVYTRHRNHARETVRHALLQCDEALGLFEPGVYLGDSQLYPAEYRTFARAGKWLGWTYWLAVLAGIGFIVVIWSRGNA
jgi:hypothetical protein